MQGNQTTDIALVNDALETAVEAARSAADVIREAAPNHGSLEWVEKSSADFVTDVDRASERKITEIIHASFPGAFILGEELTPEHRALPDALTFIADPLDGTTNFLHGYPHYAVSIGVMHEGSLIAGVVLNVPHGDLFTAKKDQGAELNGEHIRVSSIDSTSRALIGTGFPFKNPGLLDLYAKQFVAVSRETAGIRRAGSAALDLADVACGRFDGFWELVLAPWDVAAGMLLVREAGGVVTDLAGDQTAPIHGAYAAGNPQIHKWLLTTIEQIESNETD